MTTPSLRFTIVDAPAAPGASGFARAVLHRIRPGLLPWALGALVAALSMTQFNFAITTRFAVPDGYWRSIVLDHSVMIVSVMLAVLAADEAVARGARRWPTYLAALTTGCAVGAIVEWRLDEWLPWGKIHGLAGQRDVDQRDAAPIAIFFNAFLYSTLACFVYVNERTARLAADRLRAAAVARAQARRRALESRLQAMQARVEPQFLFNTLAQVRDLYERDAVLADRVLDDLIIYLRAALPHLRESLSTLGQEISLVRAYLDIMCVQRGERLRFAIDCSGDAATARVPAMLLLPLVEHALRQQSPTLDVPIEIRIAADVVDGRLRLTLDDGGVAFDPEARTGSLKDLSQRLQALYGDAMRFDLERVPSLGTRATLEIPHEPADSSDS